ncbi:MULTISPECIES: GFA family protein [unclassified Massilia]|uniref:GFA family protein n=1 Tax=unclassified Massilia TaxID=2609279 RepID=UPI001B838995|nr:MULTISPECIES: GFA family protein [unclassified Massilia]MBQ5941605.1 GFA family protein [Massilia sp. AB1]MBQ5962505.1 GFA family protein [Massilia sp. ZL223]
MKTYHGSCHCGAVRYEADFDLARGTIKCNCSICTKMRFWAVQLPAAHFRLLQGREALREYRFHLRRDGHNFCGECGINLFSTGESSALGPFVAVTVNSLDDMPVEDLMAAPLRVFDGRNDNWVTPPQETRHL